MIAAQAAATVAAVMLPDRFFLGVGTGEALNEHITGEHWPHIEERLERLEEASHAGTVDGPQLDHVGRFFRVENARIFTRPDVRRP